MQLFFPSRSAFLSCVALLMLASCTAQSQEELSVQSVAPIVAHFDSAESMSSVPVETNANQVQPTNTVEVRSTVTTAANLLSADQKAQLAQLGIKVVLPTYLPSGFQVAQFKSHQKSSPNITDYTYYNVVYAGPNNTCIEAGNGYQNTSLATAQERSLRTSVGTFKIQSGTYRQTSITRHWAELPEGNQVILTGGRLPYGGSNCNAIAEQEFDKILQSAEVIAPEPAKEQPSTALTGNLLSSEQVAKLTKLPIPIVAPTYLPEGFRVVSADGDSVKYVNGDDDAGYAIEYESNDNTCFAIQSSKDGPRRLKQVGQVESVIGTIKIHEETYKGESSLQSFIPVKGNPMMISPLSRLNPATGNYESCRALDRSDYERILRSIELVK